MIMNTTQPDLFVKMVLDAWYLHIKRTDDQFNSLSDAQLFHEVSPGRNRGVYLLGHLTAIHDRMLPLLGLGEMFQPGMYDLFVVQPYKADAEIPSVSELKSYWAQVNSALGEHFKKMTAVEWFQKHNAVSAEDFEKEPHRNRLNMIINRTNHLEYHRGQLAFLKKAEMQ